MMFTEQECPACAGREVAVLDQLGVNALIKGYLDSDTALDVSYLFKDPGLAVRLCQCKQFELKWYASASSGDAAFYESLQHHDWYYQGDKPEYDYAKSRIGAQDSVLEVGCGRGAFTQHLINGTRYRGLEFNQNAVTTARGAGLDVEKQPIEDEALTRPGHYDVVVHFQVLEHLTEPQAFMQACAQVLKPGGRLLVAVPSEDSFVGHAESCWLNMPPHHLTRWNDRALAAAFRRVGVEPFETWHEPVAQDHLAWRRQVAMQAGLQLLLGQPQALAARSSSLRLMGLACRMPGFASRLYVKGMAANPDMVRGHTVCMLGTKQRAYRAAVAC